MNTHPFWSRFFSTASWFIVAALFFSATAIWIDTPAPNGPVTQLIGLLGAQIFYCALYGIQALVLMWAKIKPKQRAKLRRNTLLVIFLTGVFTTILTYLLNGGFVVAGIDNLLISVAAGFCWLYWKFKTEYLTQEQFTEYSNEE